MLALSLLLEPDPTPYPLFPRETWTPCLVTTLATVINLAAAAWLKDVVYILPSGKTGTLGLIGIGLAFSLSMAVQFILLWLTLRRRVATLHELPIFQSLYKISVAGLFMALTIQLLKAPLAAVFDLTRFTGIFLQGLIAGLAGLATYGFIAYSLRLDALIAFLSSFKKRWLGVGHLPSEIQPPENS